MVILVYNTVAILFKLIVSCGVMILVVHRITSVKTSEGEGEGIHEFVFVRVLRVLAPLKTICCSTLDGHGFVKSNITMW